MDLHGFIMIYMRFDVFICVSDTFICVLCIFFEGIWCQLLEAADFFKGFDVRF